MYIELSSVSHALCLTTSRPNSTHSFSHDVADCKKRCNRRLACGHPCTKLCYLPCKSDCRCDKEFESVDHAVALTGTPEETHAAPFDYAEAANGSFKGKTRSYDPRAGPAKYATVLNKPPERKRKLRNSSQLSISPQLEDKLVDEGRSDRGVLHNTQPYRDFAAGGHVEYDKNLAALAEREAAEAQGKQLDDDNFAALFGDPEDAALIDKTKKMTLVRTMSNGQGGSRGVWKGTYKPPRSKNTSPSKKEEASLLDL